MLKELKIRNFVLVDEMVISFCDKLAVLTGETGAGKSVVVGALQLVLGEQIKGDVFFNATDTVVLDATFGINNIRENSYFIELVDKYEIDISDNELFFLREIKPDGKSSIFINGRKSTNSIVKEFRNILLDFHSQRDQQLLFDEETQLLYLDKYSDLMDMRDEFLEYLNQWREKVNKLKKYQEDIKRSEEKIMLYQYQIEELESANLKENEESELDQEHDLLVNAKEILELYYQMRADFFESEHTVHDMIAFYKNKLENFEGSSTLIKDTIENLATCLTALEDISVCLRHVEDEISVDSERLEEVEHRIKTIYELKNKYKKDVSQMNQYIAEMNEFIASFDKNKEDEDKLKQDIAALQAKVYEIACSLSQKRIENALAFENKIIELLQQLAIKDAEFKIVVDKISDCNNRTLYDVNEYNQTGFDRVKYLFSANKGSVLQDLKSTISGGELSRLLLVIKTIIAKRLPERTVIFDEIDSGIGGKTASMLGLFIKKMSENHQILCISHLPQVASMAEQHLKIEKVNSAEKSVITFKEMNYAERKEEIARMLSGNITDTALEHAEELLRASQQRC